MYFSSKTLYKKNHYLIKFRNNKTCKMFNGCCYFHSNDLLRKPFDSNINFENIQKVNKIKKICTQSFYKSRKYDNELFKYFEKEANSKPIMHYHFPDSRFACYLTADQYYNIKRQYFKILYHYIQLIDRHREIYKVITGNYWFPYEDPFDSGFPEVFYYEHLGIESDYYFRNLKTIYKEKFSNVKVKLLEDSDKININNYSTLQIEKAKEILEHIFFMEEVESNYFVFKLASEYKWFRYGQKFSKSTKVSKPLIIYHNKELLQKVTPKDYYYVMRNYYLRQSLLKNAFHKQKLLNELFGIKSNNVQRIEILYR